MVSPIGARLMLTHLLLLSINSVNLVYVCLCVTMFFKCCVCMFVCDNSWQMLVRYESSCFFYFLGRPNGYSADLQKKLLPCTQQLVFWSGCARGIAQATINV